MAYTPWPRQKREIRAYNTFLSSYHSRVSYHGFKRQGYELSNYFPEIPRRAHSQPAEPDFLLYNGHTALLAEVKSGDNFNPAHADQMQKCCNVSITDLEDFLEMSGIKSRTAFDGDVHEIEPFIVYTGIDQEYIEQCRQEWDDCSDDLAEIEAYAPILGQERGGRLQVLAGEFDDSNLQSWLEYGISLPLSPRTTVSLSDGLGMESVAAAICNIWGQRAVSAEVTLTIHEVRDRFDHRELQPGRVEDALSFLNRVGACSQVTRQKYRFSPEDQGTILNIGQILDQEFGNDGEEDSNGGENSNIGDFL